MKAAKDQVTSRKQKAYQALGELSGHKTVLVEIREGRTQNAVEFLEFKLDCLVSRYVRRQAIDL